MTVVVLIVQAIEAVWMVVLTAAWVQAHHRHDRLMSRVGTLSGKIGKLSDQIIEVGTKAGRRRHTGTQSVVASPRPVPPPFPIAPPPTNPMRSTGRHSPPP